MDKPSPTRMAAKLYDIRDTMRNSLGDKYQSRIDEISPYIRGYQKAHDCDEIEAAMVLSKGADGVTQIQIMATAVELIEPGGPR